jgi:hypothetical protein
MRGHMHRKLAKLKKAKLDENWERKQYVLRKYPL